MLKESAKSDLASLGRESQKSPSDRATTCFAPGEQPKLGFCIEQEIALGLFLLNICFGRISLQLHKLAAFSVLL